MLCEKDRVKTTYFVSVGNPCRKYQSWQISQILLFLSGHWKVVTLSAKIKQFNDCSMLFMLLCMDSAFVADVEAGIWKLMLPFQLGDHRWNGAFHQNMDLHEHHQPLNYPAHPRRLHWGPADFVSLLLHMLISQETSFSSVPALV